MGFSFRIVLLLLFAVFAGNKALKLLPVSQLSKENDLMSEFELTSAALKEFVQLIDHSIFSIETSKDLLSNHSTRKFLAIIKKWYSDADKFKELIRSGIEVF